MGLFSSTVYVKVGRNKFDVRHVENNSQAQVISPEPFSTDRQLVGQFTIAEACLKDGLGRVRKGLFDVSPIVVIQPTEIMDGDLSEIEERLLKELALGAGGRKAVIWTGHELSDEEVIAKAKNPS